MCGPKWPNGAGRMPWEYGRSSWGWSVPSRTAIGLVYAQGLDGKPFIEPFVLTMFTVTVAVLVPSGVPLSATV